MAPLPEEAPPAWGLKSLTASFDDVRGNQFATFANKDAARDLVEIDHILFELVADRADPAPAIPLQFFLRAHSIFRAAAACAMGGQVYEAMLLKRGIVEAAAYGLYIGDDEERANIWWSRSDSNSALDRMRTAFSAGKIGRDIDARHPSLTGLFATLYEVAIDFGAHPNESGFMMSTDMRKVEGGREYLTVYIHEDGFPLDFALKNVARAGLWVVLAFRGVYPALYASANVDDRVQVLLSRH